MLFMQDEKFLKEIDAVKEKVDNRFLKIKLIITILRNRTASELCYLLFFTNIVRIWLRIQVFT